MSNSIINYSSILKIFGFSAPANEKMLSIIILYIEMMSILFSIALVVGFIVIFCIYFFNHNSICLNSLQQLRSPTHPPF